MTKPITSTAHDGGRYRRAHEGGPAVRQTRESTDPANAKAPDENETAAPERPKRRTKS